MAVRDITAGITTGQVLRYMLLPQIIPRLKAMGSSGFSNLAYLIAMVYRAVNLLPANHPVFLPENRRHLGLRQVMGIAAANLKFTRNHIDQIVIYFTILVGMVLLALQFFLVLAYIMMNPALAQEMPTTYAEFFQNPHKDDLVYILLYAIFGVPELFKIGAERQEFHIALHSLFQFYSIGLLVVAVIIVCYFIFAVLVETAQTGVPFGKRYNHVWTPLRLVVALGLLIPVGYGLNSAQWITLYAAKLGSDYATKGWILFNEKIGESYVDPEKLVGIPNTPNLNSVVAFMTIAMTCQETYKLNVGPEKASQIKPYAIVDSLAESTGEPPTISRLILQERSTDNLINEGESEGVERRKDVLVRFGIYDPDVFTDEPGMVYPYCGDLSISRADISEPGSMLMQEFYINLISELWNGAYGIRQTSRDIASLYKIGEEGNLEQITGEFKYEAMESINERAKKEIEKAVTAQIGSETWKNDSENIARLGWGGAGIWYNKIAQVNGSLVTSINNIPGIRSRPALMTYMASRSAQTNQENLEVLSDATKDHPIPMGNSADAQMVAAMNGAYDIWRQDDSYGDFSGQGGMTGNAFIDIINVIFGTQGLFAMCQNTDIHPLGQLSMLGKGLVDASIRNIAGGVLFSVGSMVLPGFAGQALGAASGILMSVATITIVMGFMLYHVIPFMPFLYFFFAVTGWIKGLFEAMVGVPLWALSFLRIDGDGLPGNSAMDGFYLILEIFLRPIMIIFGLLASIVVFAAMVKILNEIFFIVVHNVTGNDPSSTAMCGSTGDTAGSQSGGETEKSAIEFFRGPIDEFFFTIMYAIIVYMIAMACFKLIDQIPNNILRYMGVNVNSFNDKAEDPTAGLMQRLSFGGTMISGKIFGGANEGGIFANLTGAATNTAAGIKEMNKPQPPPPEQQ